MTAAPCRADTLASFWVEIRHSDDVLAVLLILAGRQQVVVAQKFVDMRNKLVETVEQIDALMGGGRSNQVILPTKS
jgi:hypothetical protein